MLERAPFMLKLDPGQDAVGAGGAGAAVRTRPTGWAWILLLVVTVLALAADLVSKDLAFRYVAGPPVDVQYSEVMQIMYPPEPLPGELPAPKRYLGDLIPAHPPVTVIPKVLDLKLVLNPGAVFGIGAGKRLFFIAFTGAALVVALLIFWRGTGARDRLAHVCIGLLIAGGLGNLYDRLVHGCVRDFLHPLPGVKFPFGFQGWSSTSEIWPWVSNVADAFLIIGIGGLLIHLWRDGQRADKARSAAQQTK